MEVLKLCEEADKLANVRDYHAAEQFISHSRFPRSTPHPQHATKFVQLCSHAPHWQIKIDKTEELFNKLSALESVPDSE